MRRNAILVVGLATFLLPAVVQASSWNPDRSHSQNTAAGDFDGDGDPDMARGIFNGRTYVGCSAGEGILDVYYMQSDDTYPGSADESWYVDLTGLTGDGVCGDAFGAAVATGDFDNDGYDDLAVGIPEGNSGSGAGTDEAGKIHVIYGSASGLTDVGDQVFHQDTTNVESTAEAGDYFGNALASGDFDGDGYEDLAIGVMGEDSAEGWVSILYGSSTGLTATGDQLWGQDSSGIIDSGEANDNFGKALAAGDLDNDGYDDVVIGVPGEDASSLTNAGVINVIYGSSTGLTSSGTQLWWQDSTNIEEVAESNDGFGWSLSCQDEDGDGYDDISIAVPGEWDEVNGTTRADHLIYGSSSGATSTGDLVNYGDPADAQQPWIFIVCELSCYFCPPEFGGCYWCNWGCDFITMWAPDPG